MYNPMNINQVLEDFDKMCDFDKQYGNELQKPVVRQKIKSFLRQKLEEQRDEILGKIKLEKKEVKMDKIGINNFYLVKDKLIGNMDGYNQAIADLEAIKKSI
jgi:hypothetical protein